MGEYETEVLSDDALRELGEAAHQLTELEQSAAFQLFAQVVAEDYATHQHRILRGAAKSMEDYRYETGYVAGAMAALKLPEQIRKRYQSEIAAREPEQVEQSEDQRVYAGF